jgi:hypothetical protein
LKLGVITHGVEAVMPIECEIPSLKIKIKLLPDTIDLEAHIVHLEWLDEKHCDVSIVNETHKKYVNYQYEKSILSRVFY